MRLYRFALAAVLAVGIACSDASEPKPVDLTGAWKGDLNGLALNMDLAQSGTQLLGTGTFAANEPLSVTGTFIDPQVSLSINRAPYTGFTISGQQQGGRTISALVNGYMLNNVPITLTRR